MSKVLWLDLETTGLDFSRNSIVEIACIMEVDRREVSSFHSYLRPRLNSEVDVLSLGPSGFTIEGICRYQNEAEVYVDFQKWLYQFVDPTTTYRTKNYLYLAGFNVGFDKGFLEFWMATHGDLYSSFFWQDLLDVRSFTTLALMSRRDRMINGKLQSCAEAVLNRAELQAATAGGAYHGAQTDIRVTKVMFEKILKQMQEDA